MDKDATAIADYLLQHEVQVLDPWTKFIAVTILHCHPAQSAYTSINLHTQTLQGN